MPATREREVGGTRSEVDSPDGTLGEKACSAREERGRRWWCGGGGLPCFVVRKLTFSTTQESTLHLCLGSLVSLLPLLTHLPRGHFKLLKTCLPFPKRFPHTGCALWGLRTTVVMPFRGMWQLWDISGSKWHLCKSPTNWSVLPFSWLVSELLPLGMTCLVI